MSSADQHGGSTPIGMATMSPAMGEMRHYQRYLFAKIQPWLGSRILEIGVGHGTYTEWFLERCAVLAADIDAACLNEVRQRIGENARLRTTEIDLDNRRSIEACREFLADTIVCINVLEHIERDEQALTALRDVVVPGGRLVLIVPAHPALFGRMDQEAGHFRRYTRGSLSRSLAAGGWNVERARYLNVVGGVGWWFHNRVRREAGLADASVNTQMRAADRWLPLLSRLTDPWCGRWAGLSVLAVGSRPKDAA